MAKLSVNINKIATLRNSRGKNRPNLCEFADGLIDLGVTGITVHPRPDQRHIKHNDVYDLARLIRSRGRQIEFNIEGFPSEEFLSLIAEIKPTQCTLVPDPPDALTSNAGWKIFSHTQLLAPMRQRIPSATRISLFVDPFNYFDQQEKAGELLHQWSIDRIELYTEAYADAFGTPEQQEVLEIYKNLAFVCDHFGIKINAGHDLDLNNLGELLRAIPIIAEVSIGHALICDALQWGIAETVRRYYQVATTDYC